MLLSPLIFHLAQGLLDRKQCRELVEESNVSLSNVREKVRAYSQACLNRQAGRLCEHCSCLSVIGMEGCLNFAGGWQLLEAVM